MGCCDCTCSVQCLYKPRVSVLMTCVAFTIIGTALVKGSDMVIPANTRWAVSWVAVNSTLTVYYTIATIVCALLMLAAHVTKRTAFIAPATGLVVPLVGWEILGADVNPWNPDAQYLIGHSLCIIGIGLAFVILMPYEYILPNLSKIVCDPWNIASIVAFVVNGVGCILLWISAEDHEHFPLVIFICKITAFMNSFIFLYGQLLKHRTCMWISMFVSAWIQQSALAISLYLQKPVNGKTSLTWPVVAGSIIVFIGQVSFVFIQNLQLKGYTFKQICPNLKGCFNITRIVLMSICLVLTVIGAILGHDSSNPPNTDWSTGRMDLMAANAFFAVLFLLLAALQKGDLNLGFGIISTGILFSTMGDMCMWLFTLDRTESAEKKARMAGYALSILAMWGAFLLDPLVANLPAGLKSLFVGKHRFSKWFCILSMGVNFLGLALTWFYIKQNDSPTKNPFQKGPGQWRFSPEELTTGAEWFYSIPVIVSATLYQLLNCFFFFLNFLCDDFVERSFTAAPTMWSSFLALDAIQRAFDLDSSGIHNAVGRTGQVIVAIGQLGFCFAFILRYWTPASNGSYMPQEYGKDSDPAAPNNLTDNNTANTATASASGSSPAAAAAATGSSTQLTVITPSTVQVSTKAA